MQNLFLPLNNNPGPYLEASMNCISELLLDFQIKNKSAINMQVLKFLSLFKNDRYQLLFVLKYILFQL